MLLRPRIPQTKLLPQGPLDVIRQVLLFGATYELYRLTRGLVNDPNSAVRAFQHARDVIGIERGLNVFIEPSVQAFTAGQQWLLDACTWMYINAQTSVTLLALAWIYLFRNRSFYFVRNMFLIAFGIALIGYAVFPTAPPRLLPEWGFFDAVSDVTGISQDSVTVNALFNPYAAVPSMHVGFSLMVAIPLVRLVRWRALKVFWLCYPLIVTFVIVATANHFILDALLGALTAGASALGARRLGQLRPAAWRFGPAPLGAG
jgi:hypothetical protein